MTQGIKSVESELSNIISTCNRKQINNLQIRTMMVSLADNLGFVLKLQGDMQAESEKNLDGKIEETKKLIERKIMGFEELQTKIEKICHFCEEAATNSLKEVENKINIVLSKMQDRMILKIDEEEVQQKIKKQRKDIEDKHNQKMREIQKDMKQKLENLEKELKNKVNEEDFEEKLKQGVENIKQKFESVNQNINEVQTGLKDKVEGIQNSMSQFFQNLCEDKIEAKTEQILNTLKESLQKLNNEKLIVKVQEIQKEFEEKHSKLEHKWEESENRLNLLAEQVLSKESKKYQKSEKSIRWIELEKNFTDLKEEKYNRLKQKYMKKQDLGIKAKAEQKFASQKKIEAKEQEKMIVAKKQQKLPQKKQNKELKIQGTSWIDRESKRINKLIEMDNLISCSDETYIFGKTTPKRQWSCTISIISMESWIWIGLADTTYKQKQKFSNNEPNLVYCSSGNRLWDGKVSKNQGKGFKQGQQVKLDVNLDEGTVKWIVGDQVRANVANDKLKDKQIQWVLWIYLQTNGECFSVTF